MDKIKLDVFDIFAFLVPGYVLILGIWIFWDTAMVEPCNIFLVLNQFTIQIGVALIGPAYALGFALQAVGDLLLNISLRLCKGKYRELPKDSNEMWFIAREHGANHLAILERWSLLKALSQNLAAVSLLCAILFFIKSCQKPAHGWGQIGFAFLLFTGLFIDRTRKFLGYRNGSLWAVYENLKS